MFIFKYFVENPLQAMTALSLELMDITRDCMGFPLLWGFSKPLLQLTSVVVCLLVFLSLVCLQRVKCMLNRVEIWRLTWPLQNIPPFLPSKTPGLHLQNVLGHHPFVLWSAAQSTLLHLTESGPCTSEIIRLLLSYVTSSLNTSDPVALEAMHAHAITLPQHVSQIMLYTLDHELFQAFSIPFSSRHSV